MYNSRQRNLSLHDLCPVIRNRDVERERQQCRKSLHDLQGKHLEDQIRRDEAGRRVVEEARESIRPVDQREHGEHRAARLQHFTIEIAPDDQGDPIVPPGATTARPEGSACRERRRFARESGATATPAAETGTDRDMAGTDGQFPRALTTLPTTTSGMSGHSLKDDRAARRHA